MASFDKNLPSGALPFSQGDNDIRDNMAAIEERLAREHDFPQNPFTSRSGRHKFGYGTAVARNAAITSAQVGNVWFNTDEMEWQLYTGSAWVNTRVLVGAGDIAARGAAILVPKVGNVWFNTLTNVLMVYSSGAWREATPAPRGYLYDMTLSRPAIKTIQFNFGAARSADNTTTIQLEIAITKTLDNAWVAGTGLGGRAGALADGTWYFCHVIYNPTTGGVDAGFDTSEIATNLLAAATGYTKYRRIGSVYYVNAGTGIRDFVNVNNHFILKTPVLSFNALVGVAAVNISLDVPSLAAGALCYMNIYATNLVADSIIYLSDWETGDLAPSTTVAPLVTMGTDTEFELGMHFGPIRSNFNGDIRGRSAHASTTLKVATLSWTEIGR